MSCYLCDAELTFMPSWRILFFKDAAEVVCRKCKNKFELNTGDMCRICGKMGDIMCTDCSQWETTAYAGLIQSGRSLYQYNPAMKKFLHQYKFMQDIILAEVFASEINKALKKTKAVIVPIPMHPEKLKLRTFPQVERLLDAAGIPYQQFLEKSEEVQGTKTRAERLAAETLFLWNGEKVPEKVLIVDDLYTTGTTMRHAAKVLQQHGAKEISCFTLIRA